MKNSTHIRSLSSQEKLLIRILVTISVAAMVLFTAVLLSDYVADKVTQISGLKEVHASLARAVLNLGNNSQDASVDPYVLEQLESDLLRYQGWVDPSANVEVLPRIIRTYASDSGLQLLLVRNTQGSTYVQCLCRGSAAQILSFLRSVQEARPLLEVVELSIGSRNQEELTLDIRIAYAS